MLDPLASPDPSPDATHASPVLEAILGRPSAVGGPGQWLQPHTWDRRHVDASDPPPADWAHVRAWRPSEDRCVVLAAGLVQPGSTELQWGRSLGRPEEWMRIVTARLGLDPRVQLSWNVLHPEPRSDIEVGAQMSTEQIVELRFRHRVRRNWRGRPRAGGGFEVEPLEWRPVQLEQLEHLAGGGIVRYAPGLQQPRAIDRAMSDRLPVSVEVDPFGVRARLSDAATLRRHASMLEEAHHQQSSALAPVLRVAAAILLEPLEQICDRSRQIFANDVLCDVRRMPVRLDAKDRSDARAAARQIPDDEPAEIVARIDAAIESVGFGPALQRALVRARESWAGADEHSRLPSNEDMGEA